MIDVCTTCRCAVQLGPVSGFKLECRKTTCEACPLVRGHHQGSRGWAGALRPPARGPLWALCADCSLYSDYGWYLMIIRNSYSVKWHLSGRNLKTLFFCMSYGYIFNFRGKRDSAFAGSFPKCLQWLGKGWVQTWETQSRSPMWLSETQLLEPSSHASRGIH